MEGGELTSADVINGRDPPAQAYRSQTKPVIPCNWRPFTGYPDSVPRRRIENPAQQRDTLHRGPGQFCIHP
jgi:hypothetical protein